MSLLLIKFLISIKNAVLLKKELLKFFFNSKFLLLTKLLYKEGLILDFWLEKNTNILLVISLKYSFALSNFFTLKIVSVPSRYLYFSAMDISQLYEKQVLFFFSTSRGLLTSLECKQQHIGGILFFYVK